MLETEVKKLRESVDRLIDVVKEMEGTTATNDGLSAKGSPSSEDVADPYMVSSTAATNATTKPSFDIPSIEEVNKELLAVANAMGDQGAAIRTMMERDYGSTSLKDIERVLWIGLVERVKELTNNPPENTGGFA